MMTPKTQALIKKANDLKALSEELYSTYSRCYMSGMPTSACVETLQRYIEVCRDWKLAHKIALHEVEIEAGLQQIRSMPVCGNHLDAIQQEAHTTPATECKR